VSKRGKDSTKELLKSVFSEICNVKLEQAVSENVDKPNDVIVFRSRIPLIVARCLELVREELGL